MSHPISDHRKWQAVLQQRRLANINHWLDQLDVCHDPAKFVLENYDNLLRTLESALSNDQAFDLAYRLIYKMWPIVFGYVDWDRWLLYFEEALQVSHRLRRSLEEAFFLECTAVIFIQRVDYQQAESSLNKAIQIYQDVGDMEKYALALARKIEAVYHVRGDLAECLDGCQKVIQVGYELQNDMIIGYANNVRAYVYQNAREWRLCSESALLAYEAFARAGLVEKKMNALSRVILAHVFLKEWNVVDQIDAQLTEIFVSTGNIADLADHKNNVGIAAFKQKNYILAEAQWQETLSLQSQIGKQKSLAAIYNNLGKVYTKLGEWGASQEFLNKAIEIYGRMDQPYNWANSMDNLADLYEVMGDVEQCCLTLQTAVARLKDTNQASSNIQKLQSSLEQRLKNLR